MTRGAPAGLVEACDALSRECMELRSALERRGVRLARYRGAMVRMARVVSEFEQSAEPRSYAHAFEALRSIVREFYPGPEPKEGNPTT